jgi:hypothetical protein
LKDVGARDARNRLPDPLGFGRDRNFRIRNDNLPEQSGTAERQQALLDIVQHGIDFVAEYGG